MKLPRMQDAEVWGKRVFVRADLDVPLAQSSTVNNLQLTIDDDTRLRAALPTIEYLLNNEATVIVAGHLGRPQKKFQISNEDKQFSLEPVAAWFFEQFKIQNKEFMMHPTTLGEFAGWELDERLFVLENLRFYEGEETNDLSFAKKLASLADIYVNDAITVAHRNHASVVGIAKLLPYYCGLHLQKEVSVLRSVLDNPKRPLVVIIGGAKAETKLPLIEKMQHLADYVLVGGKLPIGIQNSEFRIQNSNESKLVIADLTSDETDISWSSVERFKEVIGKAALIVWNGPLGLIREDSIDSEKGTREVANAIAASNAYKIVGGGDTIDYLKRLGILSKFDFVSMGGGAMLAFLSGEKPPGLEALTI